MSNLLQLQTKEERVQLLSQTVEPFGDRVRALPDDAFPYENFKDLQKIGYPALTVPKEDGGAGIPLDELLTYQQIIARADGSTGLSIGWHMGIVKNLGENKPWEKPVYEKVVKDVVENGALLNSAATEPATGSPTRGGKPETTAVKKDNGWIITGRKNFTTLSPILTYFIVSASIDGTDDVGNFLVKHDLEGVHVEETWDSIAMRGSGSHDLVLESVHLQKDDLVEMTSNQKRKPAGWLLHVPACYLGIAQAAQKDAVAFATSYSPNSIKGTISELPNVKQKMGDLELLLLESEYFLHAVADKWDNNDKEVRDTMGPELGAVKLSVTNKAVQGVDLAMRVVGAQSLKLKNNFERYYRDVRAGLHNPPMDDMTVMQLADKSIREL